MDKRELVKTDRNGTKYWNTRVMCDRCGGTGTYRWGAIQTDSTGHIVGSTYAGTCFKCGGAGRVWEIIKEYTPEYRAKLDAANEKRKAKKDAERAEREAERAKERAEREAQWAKEREERRKAEEARKAISQHIGNVGERITATVTLEKKISFEVPSFRGFGTDTKWICIFVDESGNKLVWKTTNPLWVDGADGYMKPVCEGDTVKIKATVKEHGDFNGEKQTEVQRVKIA